MKTRRTLRAVAIGCFHVCACALVTNAQEANFSYGKIYVSIWELEPCNQGARDAIIEIDPTTGQWSFFADSDDGLCVASGLRFTPDGTRLLVQNDASFSAGSGWVQAFRSDGSSEVILDVSDGLVRPFGNNGLAFNGGGDLFVLDGATHTIVRFPADDGPGEIFADVGDGILGPGAIDVAPNGDLFYVGRSTPNVIRFTPDGLTFVFDDLANGVSVVFDRRGNLFVLAPNAELGTTLYRYDNGDAASRHLLASGFETPNRHAAIAMSPDESKVYVVDDTQTVYAVDAENGTTTVLADFSDVPFLSAPSPNGIAVYAPAFIPTVSQWGIASLTLLLASAGAILIRRRAHASTSAPHGVAFVDRIVTSAVVRQNPTGGRKVAG